MRKCFHAQEISKGWDKVPVGEAYCTQFMGGRVSEWVAKAIRQHDKMQESEARQAGREARTQEEATSSRRRRSAQVRASEQSRQMDRLYSFCRIAGHTSEEVWEILAALENVYREPFPQQFLRASHAYIAHRLSHFALLVSSEAHFPD